MHIVMTGATSGIGLEAFALLSAASAVTWIVGARTPSQAPQVVQARAKLVDLDLTSLQSARRFIGKVLEGPPIDALVLNAGIQCVSPQTSADGFELTFAVNHLAHTFIAQSLAPHMAQGGRIIFTASGTHNPDEKTGIPSPKHANATYLAYPAQNPNPDAKPMTAGRRAYSTSKLCNVMTGRSLAKALQTTRPDVAVCSYDPGFTPGTGLARNYPGPTGLIFRYVMPLFVRKGERVSTPKNSGRLLAQLVSSPDYAGARGQYFAVRGSSLHDTQPSTLALDDKACEALWTDSQSLLVSKGISL
jgi:NAD(P)-dependent dehydrogenase (short-subunit alcohol dehydrogenase family)